MKEYQFTVIKLATIQTHVSVLAEDEEHARIMALAGQFSHEEEAHRISEAVETIVSLDGQEDV